MSPDKSYPEEWHRLARLDLVRVERRPRDHDAAAAGFFLQQALEKFLKGHLISKGWSLLRIHDLGALLDEAITHNSNLEQFRPLCARAPALPTITC